MLKSICNTPDGGGLSLVAGVASLSFSLSHLCFFSHSFGGLFRLMFCVLNIYLHSSLKSYLALKRTILFHTQLLTMHYGIQ